MRDIIVLGDFNAQDEHTTMLDPGQVMYGEAIREEVGLMQQAQDMSEVKESGKHFQELGSAYGFVIYNSWSKWPRSEH